MKTAHFHSVMRRGFLDFLGGKRPREFAFFSRFFCAWVKNSLTLYRAGQAV